MLLMNLYRAYSGIGIFDLVNSQCRAVITLHQPKSVRVGSRPPVDIEALRSTCAL
jgi:hypothetical protein